MIALVAVTFADRATAEQIGRQIVDERLAACVNIGAGVTSVYRWKGKIEQAEEVSAVFKTTTKRALALAARIVALHPYELPTVEWWPVNTSPAVTDWVNYTVA